MWRHVKDAVLWSWKSLCHVRFMLKSGVGHSLIRISQNLQWSSRLWVFPGPARPPSAPTPLLTHSCPQQGPAPSSQPALHASLGSSLRSLPKHKASVPNIFLPVVLFVSKLSWTDKISHSSWCFDCRNAFHNSLILHKETITVFWVLSEGHAWSKTSYEGRNNWLSILLEWKDESG